MQKYLCSKSVGVKIGSKFALLRNSKQSKANETMGRKMIYVPFKIWISSILLAQIIELFKRAKEKTDFWILGEIYLYIYCLAPTCFSI